MGQALQCLFQQQRLIYPQNYNRWKICNSADNRSVHLIVRSSQSERVPSQSGKTNSRLARVMSNDLGGESGKLPTPTFAEVDESIVDTIRPSLPEFEACRLKTVSTPVLGKRHLPLVADLGLEIRGALFEYGSVRDQIGLIGNRRTDLAA